MAKAKQPGKRMISRRVWIRSGSVAAVSIAAAIVFLSLAEDPRRTEKTLRFDRQKSARTGVPPPPTNAVPDRFRMKYPPAERGEFRLSATEPTRIFVSATGVQIDTDSGWEPFSEEQRGEVWKLTPGKAQELFVERPRTKQKWRAYIRYSSEMRGPLLLKWQLLEAWKIKSSTNWTGRAWGGGRYYHEHGLFSAAFSE